MSKKYNLSDTKIKHLAIICYREQDTNDAGIRACASQMCNYYEKWQSKNFKDVYECVFGSGWYWSKSKNKKWVKEHPDVPQSVITAVKDVIINGKRTLPEYIDEYDQLSDYAYIINDGVKHTDKEYIMNRKNYHQDKTKVRNKFPNSDEYTFYCFPDGVLGSCDAFGYINKTVPTTVNTTKVTTFTTTIPDKATTWAEEIAADQSHGYSQLERWGPDYDCSSLAIQSYIKAGVPIDKNKVYYTGNMDGLKNYGFVDVTKKINLETGDGLLRGDILYYHIKDTNGHTALYCGGGKIVHARGQSYGSSATGDQGTEIAITNYTRSKWQHVLRYLRYEGATTNTSNTTTVIIDVSDRRLLYYGRTGADVKLLQNKLNEKGYFGKSGNPLQVDGEFGANTEYAVTQFQQNHGLQVDGIVGKYTWLALFRN